MSCRTRKGFTLLEALIALVIVGTAAIAVLSAFGTELRAAGRARDALEATALGEQHLALIVLLPPADIAPLPDSMARGRFAAPFEAYSWTASAQESRDERDLFEVSVNVEWDNGLHSRRTRLYRPPVLLAAP